MPYLQPERYFSRISHINIERDLLACGFRYVLLDIDNTILSRATHDVRYLTVYRVCALF